MSMIDPEKLAKRLLKIADRYAIERSQTKSVARTIAKAKQEAIAEAIDAVTQEIVEGKSKNPWRYFRDNDNKHIRRVRNGEGEVFCPDGKAGYSPEPLGWYVQLPDLYPEITEAEAIKILGGKPWSDSV